MVLLGDALHPIQRVGIRPAGGSARPFAQEDGILAEIAVDAFGDPEGQGVVLGARAVGGNLRRVNELIDGGRVAVLIRLQQQLKGKGFPAWGDVAALGDGLFNGEGDLCLLLQLVDEGGDGRAVRMPYNRNVHRAGDIWLDAEKLPFAGRLLKYGHDILVAGREIAKGRFRLDKLVCTGVDVGIKGGNAVFVGVGEFALAVGTLHWGQLKERPRQRVALVILLHYRKGNGLLHRIPLRLRLIRQRCRGKRSQHHHKTEQDAQELPSVFPFSHVIPSPSVEILPADSAGNSRGEEASPATTSPRTCNASAQAVHRSRSSQIRKQRSHTSLPQTGHWLKISEASAAAFSRAAARSRS